MIHPRVHLASRAVAGAIVLASIAVGAVSVSVASAAEPPPPESGSSGATVGGESNTLLGSFDAAGVTGAADRYLVQLEDGADLDRVVADFTADGVDVASTVEGAIDGFTATLGTEELAALRRRDDVVRVESDQLETVIDAQDDAPWGLDRIDERRLPLDTKYSPKDTGAGVTVYVFDTGINVDHTDFAGRLPAGAFFDFADDCPGLADCSGHGTHVAGTIGGTTWGVAKNVSIVPVKIMNRNGQSADSIVVAGINWAIDKHTANQPAVANFSLGFGEAGTIDDAVKAMIADGITVVAAAGNDRDVSSCDHHPAAVPDVITVAASTNSDVRASFSSAGLCNDLYAPGVDIESASNTSNDGSVVYSGTSMAAPHVAGAAALILDQHPRYTAAQVWAAMDADTTKGAISGTGTGEPNKLLHVTSADAPLAPTDLHAAVAPAGDVGSGEVRLTWAAPDEDGREPVGDFVIERSVDGITWTTIEDGVATTTTFTVDRLTNFTSHQFRVAAVNAIGVGAWSDPVTATPAGPPALLSGLTASVAPLDGVASGEVKLAWDPSPVAEGVTDYVIEWTIDGETWTVVEDGLTAATTVTVGELNNGTSYGFRVAAVNALGAGPWSYTVAAPAWLPAAPAGLGARPDDGRSGQVSLTWTAPVDDGGSEITDYLVQRSVDETSWTTVDDGVTTATTLIVGGLTNGTGYSFRVAAVNAVGVGPWSAPAGAVPEGPAAAPTDVTAVVAPATGVGSGEVHLTWTAPTDAGGLEIAGYQIAWSADGVSWATADQWAPADLSFTVRGLSNGTNYRFRVAAVTGLGSGAWSAPVRATPAWQPAAPGHVKSAVAPARGVGSGAVTLTWTAPLSNGSAVLDFVIERSIDGTTWTRVNDGVSPATAATVRRLVNGTVYRFRVAAVNAVGSGPWSATIQAAPRWKPTMPTALRAAVAPTRGVGSGQVKLTWIPPVSTGGSVVTDYVIQRSTDGRTWSPVRDGVSTTPTRIVAGLTNGTQYRFRVAAKNDVGIGSWSVAVRATPRAR